MKRGRRSKAETEAALSIVPLTGEMHRPKPPTELTEEQAEVWQAVVEHMPGDWFGEETHAILAEYCRHTCRARLLSQTLDTCAPESFRLDVDTMINYDRVAKAAERETRAMLACARSLRITPQARLDPKTAHRRMANQPSGPGPWEYDHPPWEYDK